MPTPTDEQMDNVLNQAIENVDEGRSQFPGMTYEEGVINAINWIRGHTPDNPMDE